MTLPSNSNNLFSEQKCVQWYFLVPLEVKHSTISLVCLSCPQTLTAHYTQLSLIFVLFHKKKKWKSLNRVWFFETPMYCILPGSSVHGILQTRIDIIFCSLPSILLYYSCFFLKSLQLSSFPYIPVCLRLMLLCC